MASQTELQQLNDRLEAEAQQMAATDLASLMHAEGRDALVLNCLLYTSDAADE